jgi:hypothetical protein
MINKHVRMWFRKFPNPKRKTASANIKECTLSRNEQFVFSCSIRLPAGIPLPVVHGPLVVPEAALLGRPVVALVTREGDQTVLGHLVHLQAVGLGGLAKVMGMLRWKCTGTRNSRKNYFLQTRDRAFYRVRALLVRQRF